MAETLVQAQKKTGRDAQLVSVIDSDLRSQPLSAPLHTLAAGLDHFVIKQHGFDAPISLLRDQLGHTLHSHTADSEILHLHGYNGALRLEDLVSLSRGKRVIWTLHDMNPFTGTCHYSLGCSGFTDSCSSCPAVKAVFRSAVEKSLDKKIKSVAEIKDLTVVAPSQWLATQARDSAVFQNHPVTVIPNPLTGNHPVLEPRVASQPPPALPGLRVCVIAQNLSDPVKNVGVAVGAFRAFHASHPEASLRLIGAGGVQFEGPGIELLGPLDNHRVQQELAQSDVVVVSSLAENAPLVIIEAASQGCQALVSDVGGMPDIIASLRHGAVFHNTQDLTAQLAAVAKKTRGTRDTHRKALVARAHALYSAEAVVAQYDKQYG